MSTSANSVVKRDSSVKFAITLRSFTHLKLKTPHSVGNVRLYTTRLALLKENVPSVSEGENSNLQGQKLHLFWNLTLLGSTLASISWLF